MRRFFIPALAALGAVAAFAGTANATVATSLTFQLTCPIGGFGCNSQPFGQIVITDNGANSVDVVETLFNGNVFAGSGAGDAIVFNIDPAKHVTITNINPAGTFVFDSTPTGVPFGTFTNAIDYTGNGTSPPNYTHFSFSTSDGTTLTVQDFVANAYGYYFASDIGVANAEGRIVATGNVAANVGFATPTPEPASIAVMGVGLLGLGFTMRRKATTGKTA